MSISGARRSAPQFAQASLPEPVLEGIRLGRLTALQKPQGGVRGVVVGVVVGRLVAKTMAQQLGPAVEASTSPFQYAVTTRASCECVAHALQALSESDPEATIVSFDGVSGAMMAGLRTLPFVRMSYGRPSTCIWEFADGTVHHIPQGEGGEQGQHPASVGAQARLEVTGKMFAYLDDVSTEPSRTSVRIVARELWRIRTHRGKTQVWNTYGTR